MKKITQKLIFVFSIFFLISGIQSIAQSKEDLKYFQKRRQTVIESMKNGIAVVSSTSVEQRAAEFYYLSGYQESDAYLVIDPSSTDRFIVYTKSSDLNNIKNVTGADEVYSINRLKKDLIKKTVEIKRVYIRNRDELC